jgi:hypothetical protein
MAAILRWKARSVARCFVRHRAAERSIHLDEKVSASSCGAMRPQVIFGLVVVLLASVSIAGCWKKSGLAVVLEKEHIDAKEITSTPAAQGSVSPSSPTPGLDGVVIYEEVAPRELAEDEISVDSYVMKKDERGTSRDPRARQDEQWIVKVQMVDDLRRFNVQTDKLHFDKLKVGDRIKVSYRQGKYTGTIWHAEID